MPKSEKVLSEQIADKIYDMIIIEKNYSIGDKLPNENELAAQFGVSRTTLREAIRFLVAQGVLEIKRGRGTFVADNTSIHNDFGFEELEYVRLRLKDLFEIRMIFEPQTAYLAAKRATEEELKRILDLGKMTEEAILKNENRTEIDQAFHRAIVKATHNEFMIRLIPIINKAIAETVIVACSDPKFSEHTLRDHRLIMNFLQERNAFGAKDAMSLHIRHAISSLGLKYD